MTGRNQSHAPKHFQTEATVMTVPYNCFSRLFMQVCKGWLVVGQASSVAMLGARLQHGSLQTEEYLAVSSFIKRC